MDYTSTIHAYINTDRMLEGKTEYTAKPKWQIIEEDGNILTREKLPQRQEIRKVKQPATYYKLLC